MKCIHVYILKTFYGVIHSYLQMFKNVHNIVLWQPGTSVIFSFPSKQTYHSQQTYQSQQTCIFLINKVKSVCVIHTIYLLRLDALAYICCHHLTHLLNHTSSLSYEKLLHNWSHDPFIYISILSRLWGEHESTTEQKSHSHAQCQFYAIEFINQRVKHMRLNAMLWI